jgi:hypothetical protein
MATNRKKPVDNDFQGHAGVDYGHSLAGKNATIPYFLANQ